MEKLINTKKNLAISAFVCLVSITSCSTANSNKSKPMFGRLKTGLGMLNKASKSVYKTTKWTANQAVNFASRPRQYTTNVYRKSQYVDPDYINYVHPISVDLYKINTGNCIINKENGLPENADLYYAINRESYWEIQSKVSNQSKNQEFVFGFLGKTATYGGQKIGSLLKGFYQAAQGMTAYYDDIYDYDEDEIIENLNEDNSQIKIYNQDAISDNWIFMVADEGDITNLHKRNWLAFLGATFTESAETIKKAEELAGKGYSIIADFSKDYFAVGYKGSIYYLKKISGNNADVEQFVNSLITFIEAYIDFRVQSVKLLLSTGKLALASVGVGLAGAQLVYNPIHNFVVVPAYKAAKEMVFGSNNNKESTVVIEEENLDNMEDVE